MAQATPDGESHLSATGMPDGELMSRLNRLQRELNIMSERSDQGCHPPLAEGAWKNKSPFVDDGL
jgi:hypothetical protein